MWWDDWTLDIELNNGHIILFDIQHLIEEDPNYKILKNLEVLPRPSTDGKSIFWRGGPIVTLNEIITRLSQQDNKG